MSENSKTNQDLLKEVIEFVQRCEMSAGREGCTYGDTDYDSISVVYGYNSAIENISQALIAKLKEITN